jgi:hypothetical protein
MLKEKSSLEALSHLEYIANFAGTVFKEIPFKEMLSHCDVYAPFSHHGVVGDLCHS